MSGRARRRMFIHRYGHNPVGTVWFVVDVCKADSLDFEPLCLCAVRHVVLARKADDTIAIAARVVMLN